MLAPLLLSLALVPSQDPQASRFEAMAGALRADSVLLQARVPGPGTSEGLGRFLFWRADAPEDVRRSASSSPRAELDFVVKAELTGLRPDTRYEYRFQFEPGTGEPRNDAVQSFRTLPGAESDAAFSFAVVTGMNYHKFHARARRQPDEESGAGYPALETLRESAPHFVVSTGDSVYYDQPREGAAVELDAMRRKWREQFAQPRFRSLLATTPFLWEVDDHDFRYDDCDLTGQRAPSAALGARVLFEQVPLAPWTRPQAPRYRSFRASALAEVWLTDVRHYRSANRELDGPEKSLWGAEQRQWLLDGILGSDAKFKIVVSPTPMVGPDDLRKKDNHTNVGGFRHEGQAFFAAMAEAGIATEELVLLCGDRHWQYHSIHPSGYEEFSCGALVDANARLGRKPGDAKSTDPDGAIVQPWTQPAASGGFLHVVVEADGDEARLRVEFRDERGVVAYAVERRR